jgi:hypothetical protein
MSPQPARSQVRPARRGQHTNASRGVLAARAALASARARAAAPQLPNNLDGGAFVPAPQHSVLALRVGVMRVTQRTAVSGPSWRWW